MAPSASVPADSMPASVGSSVSGPPGGDQPGGLGLHDDAGHVVGDDVVQLPGQLQALVAAGGIDRELVAGVDEPQPYPHAERALPQASSPRNASGRMYS